MTEAGLSLPELVCCQRFFPAREVRCLLPEAGLPLAQVEATQLAPKQSGVSQEGVVGGGLQVVLQHYPIGQWQYSCGAVMAQYPVSCLSPVAGEVRG